MPFTPGTHNNEDEKKAVALAEQQLVAYNARDIKAFTDCYASDVTVETLGTGQLDVDGKLEFFTRYKDAFDKEPNVRCKVVNRLVHGKFVIDTEELTGFYDGKDRSAVAIYETNGKEITRVWFVRK